MNYILFHIKGGRLHERGEIKNPVSSTALTMVMS